MKKKIDTLTAAIAVRLEGLPPTVPAISTKKLLESMDVEGYSPDSVQRAVAAVDLKGWQKVARSFFRDKPQCSPISRNDKPQCSPISRNVEDDPTTAELDRILPKPEDFKELSLQEQQRWLIRRGELRRKLETAAADF